MSVNTLSTPAETTSVPEQLRTSVTAWPARISAATFLVIVVLFATAAAAGATPFYGI